jgi:hypothetical protein
LPALTALTMNQEVTLMTCLLLVKSIGDGLLLGVKKMLPALHGKIVHEKFELVTHKNLRKRIKEYAYQNWTKQVK